MDLAQAVNSPEEIELDGKEYRVRLLTMREWAVLSVFIKKNVPSPVTNALLAVQQARTAGEVVGQAAQDDLLDHAQRMALRWPPRLGTTAWFDAINSIEGGDARLLLEILNKCDPSFDEARAAALVPRLSDDEWGDLIRVSLYGTHPRPKGDGGTGASPTTGPTTTRTSGTSSSPDSSNGASTPPGSAS
jgi:hypothetical protein